MKNTRYEWSFFFGYSQYNINYAKKLVFLLFFIKNSSANNSGFIYSFDKLKMKERYEAIL